MIKELKQGDEKAFKYIYDSHYVLLCRFACQLLEDSSLAEEIVDDAIFYLWEHRADIEITYSIRAYLMRAVRNRCLNELNSLSHRKELRFSSFYGMPITIMPTSRFTTFLIYTTVWGSRGKPKNGPALFVIKPITTRLKD